MGIIFIVRKFWCVILSAGYFNKSSHAAFGGVPWGAQDMGRYEIEYEKRN